jgi:hypothetical protein
MGEGSRLLSIILSERLEDQGDPPQASRDAAGLSPLLRLSRSFRRSWSKLRSLGSRRWKDARAPTSDSAFSKTTPNSRKPTEDEERKSLDSGLETEGSADDQESSFLEKKISSPVLTTVKHNSSNLSSQTFDSGLHVRFSPSCLVYKNVDPTQNVPKKRVSIRLPVDREASSLFGPHLQIERAQTFDKPRPASRETVSQQTQRILDRAMAALLTRTPEICDTVQLLFQPDSLLYLKNLNSTEIGNLMFDLRTVLFTGLKTVPYFETSLFMVQSFLLNVSSILLNIPGLHHFHGCFQDLLKKCRRSSYSDHSFCLKETQSLYIDLWCSLINAL